MNVHAQRFETPEVKTRKDSIATSAVLATIVLSVLSGMFAVDPGSAAGPVRYAAVEEVNHE